MAMATANSIRRDWIRVSGGREIKVPVPHLFSARNTCRHVVTTAQLLQLYRNLSEITFSRIEQYCCCPKHWLWPDSSSFLWFLLISPLRFLRPKIFYWRQSELISIWTHSLFFRGIISLYLLRLFGLRKEKLDSILAAITWTGFCTYWNDII